MISTTGVHRQLLILRPRTPTQDRKGQATYIYRSLHAWKAGPRAIRTGRWRGENNRGRRARRVLDWPVVQHQRDYAHVHYINQCPQAEVEEAELRPFLAEQLWKRRHPEQLIRLHKADAEQTVGTANKKTIT